jgi:hypothetical protein
VASHRGAHPEDDDQFARSKLPTLRAAVHDLSWLRTRDYGDTSSIKIVGDRYQLTRRQRDAVARSACSDPERAHRLVRRRELEALAGRHIHIDGFNVLISVEGLLGGAYLFVGRDCAVRDVNPVRGTYRIVEETGPAIRAVRRAVQACWGSGVTWWLDAHVSNVGRLKERLAELAPPALAWKIRLHDQVDDALISSDSLVATSDSAVLDRVSAWCSVEQMIMNRSGTEPNVRDLRPRHTTPPASDRNTLR